MVRLFAMGFAVLAVALFLAMPTMVIAADEDTHDGKIVSAGNSKLTMTDKDGKNEMTHTVGADAVITLDGKEVKLDDLKAGFAVKVTTKKGEKNVAIKIEATSKDK
jgi:hypothetical protein